MLKLEQLKFLGQAIYHLSFASGMLLPFFICMYSISQVIFDHIMFCPGLKNATSCDFHPNFKLT